VTPQPQFSLRLVRLIQAPPDKVYAALTDPDKMLRWWSPDAGPTIEATTDVRPGGRFEVTFRAEDGKAHTNYGTYREVVIDRKLVFTWHWRASSEHESLVTILLEPWHGGTRLTLVHEGLPTDADRDDHRDGWSSGLEKLSRLFP
jgi:uncharacterized protein YndB with AHSA1/START domain